MKQVSGNDSADRSEEKPRPDVPSQAVAPPEGGAEPSVPANLSLTLSGSDLSGSSTPQVRSRLSQPHVDALVGRNLGHFRIDEAIGAGGMGTVYRAFDLSLQRLVAVKVMHSSRSSDSSARSDPAARSVTAARSDSGVESAKNPGAIPTPAANPVPNLAANPAPHPSAPFSLPSGPVFSMADTPSAMLVTHGASASASSIMQEAIAQARLNHPNIVTIYYVGRDGEEPFMAMELLPGETLADRVRNGPIAYHLAIGYALRIVDALQHAQSFGLIHADIKPSNLLVTPTGEIKLTDFGLARSTEAEQSKDGISGTPHYLAPELVDGQRCSIQSDMYAVGVSFFEFLFGRYPFELRGETLREKLQTHQNAPIEYPAPWPKQIPVEVRPLLGRLLAKDPADRFPDYTALQAELQELRPVRSVDAGIVLRFLAFVIDQSILMFVLSVVCGSAEIRLADSESDLPTHIFVALIGILLFSAHLMWIRRDRKTFGRFAFQLRAVDQHGLRLTPAKRVVRECLRSILPLMVFALWPLPSAVYWPVIGIATGAFLLSNLVSLIATQSRLTMHDRIVHSRSRLDSAGIERIQSS